VLATAPKPYPASILAQASYWDELLSSFILMHGPEFAAEVFGIEVRTARWLLYDTLFSPPPPRGVFLGRTDDHKAVRTPGRSFGSARRDDSHRTGDLGRKIPLRAGGRV
jgi:hypothetical protein